MAQACPRCFAALDDSVLEDPRDGDVSACGWCGQLLLIGPHGRIRLPNAREFRRLMRSPRIWGLLVNVLDEAEGRSHEA